MIGENYNLDGISIQRYEVKTPFFDRMTPTDFPCYQGRHLWYTWSLGQITNQGALEKESNAFIGKCFCD